MRKVAILSYDKICISSNSTINKLVIIFVNIREQMKVKIGFTIVCHGVTRYCFHYIVCYIGMILNASPNIKLLNYSLVELARDLMPSALLSAFMSAVILCAGSFIGNDLIKLLVQTLLGVCVYAGTAALIRAESFIYIMDTIRGIGKKRG